MIVNDADITGLIKKDKRFKEIYNRLGAPPNWFRPQGFASLSKIILEQQVSLASANAHFQKLQSFIKVFSPENILLLADEEMRACQISRQKSRYLRLLSEMMLKDPCFLENLKTLPEQEARKRLVAIKGIGQWTADIYLMFCLQEKDIFPIGDIAVVRTIRELSNAGTQAEMLLLAEKWKPFRSLATYFLWHHYLLKRNRHVPAEGYAALVQEPGSETESGIL